MRDHCEVELSQIIQFASHKRTVILIISLINCFYLNRTFNGINIRLWVINWLLKKLKI